MTEPMFLEDMCDPPRIEDLGWSQESLDQYRADAEFRVGLWSGYGFSSCDVRAWLACGFTDGDASLAAALRAEGFDPHREGDREFFITVHPNLARTPGELLMESEMTPEQARVLRWLQWGLLGGLLEDLAKVETQRALQHPDALRWLAQRDRSREAGDRLARAVSEALAVGDYEKASQAVATYVETEAPSLRGIRGITV